MSTSFSGRGAGRGARYGSAAYGPRPASRAPHASTAKVDLSELRNPSAIYSQAQILATQSVPSPAAQFNSHSSRRFGSSTLYANSPSSNAGLASNPAAQALSRVSDLAPHASGSSSTLYRTILKTPTLTQMYMHGQFSSNAPDVLRQFTAELRFFQTVQRHRNIVAFVGSLEGVGMLLEYVEGETLFKYLGLGMSTSTRADWFNQILNGLCHVHSFGLAHNDLCSLNVIITTPNSPISSSKIASNTKNTRYVVKLIDFGRSTVEPRPPPIPSALAALRSRPTTSVPASEDQQRQKAERERDLIYPGTRPFASPEIMRAWKMSEAGSTQILHDDESNAEDNGSESEGEVSDVVDDMEMDRPSHGGATPYGPLTLPLPLSTSAYMGDSDDLNPVSPPFAPTVAGSRMRAKLPILYLTENSTTVGSSTSTILPTPTTSSPCPGASRIAPQRNHSHLSRSRSPYRSQGHTDPYPSPTSSPSGSQPSSPSNHPKCPDISVFPHDPGFDVDETSGETKRRGRSRVLHSPSARHFASSSVVTPSHRYHQSQSRTRTGIGVGQGQKTLSRRAQKAAQMAKITTLYSVDPFPLSPILGDTYSLGVIALCLEVDDLVDVQPGVQMCEEWDWPRELAEKRSGLFEGKGGVGGTVGEWGSIERYMRMVRERERCRASDALDVDAIKEIEREEEIMARSRATLLNPSDQ